MTRWTARFVRRNKIAEVSLAEAVSRANEGLIDADLGGGLIKMRVARSGQGRSGVYRTIIAFKAEDRAVFLYAFAKNERDNIGKLELETLKELAAVWFRAQDGDILKALAGGQLEEIEHGGE